MKARFSIVLVGVMLSLVGVARSQPSTPGSLDTSFVAALNSNAAIYAVALQTNGQILIGGSFTNIGGVAVTNLARLNTNGTLDISFSPGGAMDKGYVDALAIQPDGRVLAGGFFASSSFAAPANLARLNTNGSVDLSFDSGLYVDSAVNAVVVLRSGGILFGGSFANVDGYVRRSIAQLYSNGALDINFDACVASSAGAGATGLAVQPDDYILASGEFGFISGDFRQGIARLSSCGLLDRNYAPQPGINPDGTAFTMLLPGSGFAFLGGNFTNYNGTNVIGIVQLDGSGLVANAFTPAAGINFGGTNFSVALQPDGKIIIAGEFSSYNGTTRHRLARLFPNGTLDPQFDSGTGPDNTIGGMAIQADGKILVGGKFASFNGSPRIALARINGDQPRSRLSQPTVLGNGQFRLVFSGADQVHYALQASSNFATWAEVTNFISSTNPMTLYDPSAVSFPRRFYRAVSLP